jgi:hypothetical protein
MLSEETVGQDVWNNELWNFICKSEIDGARGNIGMHIEEFSTL